MIHSLLILYIRISLSLSQTGHTPLVIAAEKGHKEAVELLLSKGSKINHQTKVNITGGYPQGLHIYKTVNLYPVRCNGVKVGENTTELVL